VLQLESVINARLPDQQKEEEKPAQDKKFTGQK